MERKLFISCLDQYESVFENGTPEVDRKTGITNSRVNNVGEIFSEKRKEKDNITELGLKIKDFSKKLKKRDSIIKDY